jgi:hypothetical protein
MKMRLSLLRIVHKKVKINDGTLGLRCHQHILGVCAPLTTIGAGLDARG